MTTRTEDAAWQSVHRRQRLRLQPGAAMAVAFAAGAMFMAAAVALAGALQGVCH